MSSTGRKVIKAGKSKRKKSKPERKAYDEEVTYRQRSKEEPQITSDQMALPSRRKVKPKREKKSKEREMLLGVKSPVSTTQPPPEVAIGDEDEDYGDEEFEDYVDDFDDEQEESVALHRDESKHVSNREDEDTRDEMKASEKLQQVEYVSPTKLTTPKHSATNDSTESKLHDTKQSNSIPLGEAKHNETPVFDNHSAAAKLGMSDIPAFLRSKSHHSRRVRELSKLVELEVESAELFEMHSLQSWDYYIQSIGALGQRKQASSQTGESAREIGIQTETIETTTIASNIPEVIAENDLNDVENDDAWEAITRVTNAVQKMMDEELRVVEYSSEGVECKFDDVRTGRTSHSTNMFGSWSTVIGDLDKQDTPYPKEIFNKHSIEQLCFSVSHPSILLTVHRSLSNAGMSRVCVWNVNSNELVFGCDTPLQVTACVLHGSQENLAIVLGTIEGSVCLLPRNRAYQGESDLPMMLPEWSTDGALGDDSCGHETQVCDIRVLDVSFRGKSSIPFATLDTNAVVQIWTLVQDQADFHTSFSEAGSKLVHVTQIGPNSISSMVYSTVIATCLSCSLDGAYLFVGTVGGAVLRYDRFGSSEYPSRYEPSCSTMTVSDAVRSVTCIEFHPALKEIFLVGFSDGSLIVFNIRQALPLRTWAWEEDTTGISKVKWSPKRADVFYTQDTDGTINAWDLKSDSENPLHSEPVANDNKSGHTILDVTGDLTKTMIAYSSDDSVVTVRNASDSYVVTSMLNVEHEREEMLKLLNELV